MRGPSDGLTRRQLLYGSSNSTAITVEALYLYVLCRSYTYKNMKAALFYGKGDVRVEDIPKPEPRDDEVLIEVDWCGICGILDS